MSTMKRLSTVFLLCLIAGTPLSSWAAAQPRIHAPTGAVGDDSALAASAPTAALPAGGTSADYVLGTGDRVKLTVYGEADLSGEYEISSTGVISLPLIGTIPAAKRTIHDFEQAVVNKLSEGYLKDPRVSAQVVNYRPFFILGEVSKPGSYPYVNGMTIVNAVALAGGYTYRADKTEITITRGPDQNKKEMEVSEEIQVMPGDVIKVPERYF